MPPRMAVLKFATDLDNLLLPGKIEEVSVPLLEHILLERDHLFAFLYDEEDGRDQLYKNRSSRKIDSWRLF